MASAENKKLFWRIEIRKHRILGGLRNPLLIANTEHCIRRTENRILRGLRNPLLVINTEHVLGEQKTEFSVV